LYYRRGFTVDLRVRSQYKVFMNHKDSVGSPRPGAIFRSNTTFVLMFLAASGCYKAIPPEESPLDTSGAGSDTEADTNTNSDIETDDNGDTGPARLNYEAPTDGPCEAEMASTPCDQDCVFDASTIDCNTACENSMVMCATDLCKAAMCAYAFDVVSPCVPFCEERKDLICPNVLLGCFQSSTVCDDVETCLVLHL
jgi:hypothetical protein